VSRDPWPFILTADRAKIMGHAVYVARVSKNNWFLYHIFWSKNIA